MKVCKNLLLGVCALSTALLVACNSNRQVKIHFPSESVVTAPPAEAPVPVHEPPAQPPAPTSTPAAPEPAQTRPDSGKVLASAEQLFTDGKARLKGGDIKDAKTKFDSAVDLILSSGIDLRSNRRLKTLFDELFNQLYQLEAVAPAEAREDEPERPKGKEDPADQKYEPAAVDELENINVYPLSIEPGLQHLVEEDIASTKYDIPVVVNEDVLRWLEYYKSRGRKIMELGLKRIGLYRDMIHRVFQEFGVPKDLIYVAQQESMFKPLARSRANAKGMWQFVYGTGKRYGLSQNLWIDEKLDPEKATRAAAQHLTKLYEMFGDWYLVMAAYNAGEYGIQRITEKTGIRNFWELAERKLLYKQTVDYVPSILATMIISKHPEKYGFDAQPLPPIASKRVRIPSPVDLSLVAESVGVSLDEIRQLNPELRRMVTPVNQKHYEINLPVDKSEEAVKSLAAIPIDKRVRWQSHVIQEGDTLWDMSRHYRISVDVIMDANNMSSSRLRVGRTLLIPPSSFLRSTTRVAGAGTPAKVAASRPVTPTQTSSKTPPKGSIRLTVSSSSPAASPRAIQGKVPSNSYDPPAMTGRGLTTSSVAPLPVSAKPVADSRRGSAAPSERKVIHKVQRGDTLYEIARRYKITADQVRKWNGLTTNLLHPGDSLLIFIPR